MTNVALPEKFSLRVSTAIEAGQLLAENRSAFVRECVDFLEPILPTPSKEQFNDISKRLCDKYLKGREEDCLLGKGRICYTYNIYAYMQNNYFMIICP